MLISEFKETLEAFIAVGPPNAPNNTRAWSKELWGRQDAPDGIRYRARHDDSGLSDALVDGAASSVEEVETIELLDPRMAIALGRWADRYKLGLSS